MDDVKLNIPPTATPEQLFDLHDRWQKLFVEQLKGTVGDAAREHLRGERGLSEATTDEAGIGYVREGGAPFVEMALSNGLSLELSVEAGLVKRSEYQALKAFTNKFKREPGDSSELSAFFFAQCRNKREFYRDYHSVTVEEGENKKFFYGDWLVLPMRVRTDKGIRIGGFQLRSMRPKEQIGKMGRYRNPVNTAAMLWAETLIGLAEEYARIEKVGEVILVEGKFDQMSVIEALRGDARRPGVVGIGGIKTRGAGAQKDATPQERAGILAQLPAKKVRLFLDSDEPGTEAILQLGPKLSAMDMLVGVCRIDDVWQADWGPIPKDAGEALERRGAETVRAIVDSGKKTGLVSYATQAIETRLAAGLHGGQTWSTLLALDVLLPLLKAAPAVVRERALSRAAEVLGMPVSSVASLVPAPETRGEELSTEGGQKHTA